MCGITGLLNIDGRPVSEELLVKMTDSISHRGPDGEGVWIERNVGLGHRRLSVIDIGDGGKQPMHSNDKRWILTYNGEIYNYKELKLELINKGFNFKTRTDTEVVLNSLINWGTDAISKFNGMFAFALWDRLEQKLLIARDRYGIKPIYYAFQDNKFLFGSEQKTILSDSDFRRTLNKPALLEYCTFQNIFTDQVLLNDIKLLPGGCYGTLNLTNQSSLNIVNYWDYSFREPEEKLDKQEYVNELNSLFKRAVKNQLVSDVEIGSYLSGGIDSGSISAVASTEIPFLKTFTCGFDLSSASGIELGFDERNKAEEMSAIFNTEHYEIVLKAGDMERCLSDLAHHLEEPRVGQSYPNYYSAKLASKFVKVVLSGSGGDELFGGYPWRYYRAANCQSFENYIDEYYLYWQRLLSNKELKKVFSPISNEVKDVWTRDIFKSIFKNHKNTLSSPEDFINHSLYFEAKTFLHGLFIVEDKLSMAHGLENRVPFMDNDLVDFAMKCPINLKLNNLSNVLKIDENESVSKKNLFFRKTNDGKQILREAMRKIVPESITSAEKKGFSSPDSSWFRGQSISFVKENLLNRNACLYNYLDFESVNSLIDEHIAGKKNRRLFIWSMLNLEAWMKKNL
ncbi:asparagine synthase (glutamine-hydrolyzing) [bacterium]|nr:asparagine synthase (glutamine-hydrolyzing) [bacterium]|tara:strand:- start:48 stop:1922 length:1875 start_codon:yes stop_codon:yes gene_type:complete